VSGIIFGNKSSETTSKESCGTTEIFEVVSKESQEGVNGDDMYA